MRGLSVILLVAATAAPAVLFAQEGAVDGSAAAIRTVVSGKICTGQDVLVFGMIVPGSAGTFERKGRRSASYSIGYGTILIRRDQDLHGHVTSVSVPNPHAVYEHRHLPVLRAKSAGGGEFRLICSVRSLPHHSCSRDAARMLESEIVIAPRASTPAIAERLRLTYVKRQSQSSAYQIPRMGSVAMQKRQL